MLQLGRIIKVKVFFLVLVYAFNIDLFEFSAAILEKGLLYSSIACFVWKPEHFEFPSYGGARHKATTELVEKYIFIS